MSLLIFDYNLLIFLAVSRCKASNAKSRLPKPWLNTGSKSGSAPLPDILLSRRKADHEAANAERKLTPAQKAEKTARKLKEDTTAGVNVAVYRYIRHLGFIKGMLTDFT